MLMVILESSGSAGILSILFNEILNEINMCRTIATIGTIFLFSLMRFVDVLLLKVKAEIGIKTFYSL